MGGSVVKIKFDWKLMDSNSALKLPIKTFLEWLDGSLDDFPAEDPNLKVLSKILKEAEDKEEREELKLRWRALRKFILHLLSYDGAYRWRCYYALKRVLEEKDKFSFSSIDIEKMNRERW
jgi:hypothetical protein